MFANSRIEKISEPCQPTLPNMTNDMMEEVMKKLGCLTIDPNKPNLLTMPRVGMEEVLRNLDCSSIFRLRKVCRDLRCSIDEIKPELHVDSLQFYLPLTMDTQESIDGPTAGCILRWNQGYMYRQPQISIEEAKTLLSNKKLVLDTLIIELHDASPMGTIQKKEIKLKKFLETMNSLLKNESCLLKTKEILIDVYRLSQAGDLLKYIDPKSLKKISLGGKTWDTHQAIETDFSEIEALEQWKNAEELKIRRNFILAPVESFASFKTIIAWADAIKMEKLNKVKELFIRSPNMKTFIIESHELDGIKDQILSNFGPFHSCNETFFSLGGGQVGKQSTWIWLNDVPGSTEKLQIILNVGRKTGSLSLRKLPIGNCDLLQLESISNFRYFAT